MENQIRESHNNRFADIHRQMKEYSDAHDKRLYVACLGGKFPIPLRWQAGEES